MENNIEGFKWFLPLIYKDSISQCKFEQGDVIYKSKTFGKNWGEEIKEMNFFIQVKSPIRSTNMIVIKGNEENNIKDVFSSNWYTKIVFEKIYPNNPSANQIIETTQGVFFSFLWKDDEQLFTTNTLEPCIASIKPKDINIEFIKTKVPIGSIGFAIITDSVSDLYVSKRNDITKVLRENFDYSSQMFTCEEAIIDKLSSSGFSPTLGVELFIINTNDGSKIEEDLKKVLFKGKKDRFNIKSHGSPLITN